MGPMTVLVIAMILIFVAVPSLVTHESSDLVQDPVTHARSKHHRQ